MLNTSIIQYHTAVVLLCSLGKLCIAAVVYGINSRLGFARHVCVAGGIENFVVVSASRTSSPSMMFFARYFLVTMVSLKSPTTVRTVLFFCVCERSVMVSDAADSVAAVVLRRVAARVRCSIVLSEGLREQHT